MKQFKAEKGKGYIYILMITLIYNILIIVLANLINSYIFLSFLKVALVIFNIYQIYYILLSISLKYAFDNDNVYINYLYGAKKIAISFNKIEAYNKSQGHIKGVRLTGFARNTFAFGKSIVDKVGITNMFVTASNNVIYLKTEEMTYAISPERYKEFEGELISRKVEIKNFEYKVNKNINLYKDGKFSLPFFLVAVIAIILTVLPFSLYISNKLPYRMPLTFNSAFNPIKFGTGRQFAFKQMTYGILNMGILFCMYYSSYFYAKYDKKSAYKFIYIALIVAVTFLVIQLKILYKFM